MPNILDVSNIIETEIVIIEKLKTILKKNKDQKIKIIIEDIITLSKVACGTKTQVITFALQNLIMK